MSFTLAYEAPKKPTQLDDRNGFTGILMFEQLLNDRNRDREWVGTGTIKISLYIEESGQ